MNIFIYPHVSPYEIKWTCPRTELIVSEGLAKIKNVNLVNSVGAADFVIFHHVPQFGGQKSFELINQIDPKKLIVIDSVDENNEYFVQEMSPDNYFLYFKRSLVKQSNAVREVIPTIERQYPWDYAILDGFIRPEIKKTIDVGCYLRNSCYYRSLVIQNMMHWFHQNQEKYLIYIGEVSKGSRADNAGNVEFDKTYFEFLAKTKIIVSSGPYGWIGDSRGAEAVANKCLYFSNEFFDLMPKPPIADIDYIRFNPLDYSELFSKLDWLVDNQRAVATHAKIGYEHCMKYHTSLARMKYVLEKIEENA